MIKITEYVVSNEQEFVIAQLKAQILIEKAKQKAYRQYSLNKDFNILADHCGYIIKHLTTTINELLKS